MRKFKITNRVKRKYVRKPHHVSSLPVIKTWNFNLFPLAILGIALITLGIVFRNMYGNIPLALTIQLPTFSFSMLIGIFQSAWGMLVLCALAIQSISMQVISIFLNMIKIIDLQPVFSLLLLTINTIYSVMIYSITQIIRYELTLQFLYFQINAYLYAELEFLFLTAANGIYYLFVASYNFTIFTILHICSLLIVFSQYAAVQITIFLHNALYFFGTPFRVLAAFWLVIKPYVDYFLAHVQMTFKDFNYGVHSLSSISSLKPAN